MAENMLTGQMVYLNVENLFPHPDNPRKDLGDLTELADSIKQNGVLQNLTVVPKEDGGYTVIIGHRRLAAAKVAGLETVPCVVAEMPEKEQLQTMLVENMQRSDLTVYEEAQGFQMMLDLGESVESIAEKSGFSQTTVRRRVKLLDLDKDKFKRAESRGATLEDYAALDKLTDVDAKNKVLDSVGTPDFQNELKKAVASQKFAEKKAEWIETIKTFATENLDCDYQSHKYICNYGRWNLSAEVRIPEDADKVTYYYRVGNDQIDIYCDKDDDRESAEREKREAERRESERIRDEFEEITEMHFELRSDFVRKLSNTACKKHAKEISALAARIFWDASNGGYSRPQIKLDVLSQCLGIALPDDVEDQLDEGGAELDEIAGIASAAESMPEKLMFCLAYSAADKPTLGYWSARWGDGKYEYGHTNNDLLTYLYELLEALGYEMSEEETKMRTGFADIFEKYGGESKAAVETTELDEKSDADFDAALRDQLKHTVGDVDGV